MNKQTYPGVSVRVKAVVTDSVVLVVLIIGITTLFERIENVPDFVRLIAFVFVFLLYDPILTSFSGGTIGHKLMGIKVKKDKNQQKNILFPLAVVRYVIKVLLGWISLLTVSGDKSSKAIHDWAVGSVVLYKSDKGND